MFLNCFFSIIMTGVRYHGTDSIQNLLGTLIDSV